MGEYMSSKIEKNLKKITEVADHFGLSRSTVSYILNDKWKQRRINEATAEKVWNYVRAIGFKPNMMSLALRGRPIKEIAKDLGLSEGSLRAWVKQADTDALVPANGPLTTLERQELSSLRVQVKRLTEEKTILKKAAVFFARASR